MKRILSAVLLMVMLLLLCSCENSEEVTLVFREDGLDICQVLPPEDAQRVKDILSNMTFEDLSFFVYSGCGFSPDVSIRIGNRIYGMAMDKCANVYSYSSFAYYGISQADRLYIESLFAQYGGYFPCV